jgi:hypothetical protein
MAALIAASLLAGCVLVGFHVNKKEMEHNLEKMDKFYGKSSLLASDRKSKCLARKSDGSNAYRCFFIPLLLFFFSQIPKLYGVVPVLNSIWMWERARAISMPVVDWLISYKPAIN